MRDEGKPVWPWIVALLIGLPVLYVVSFGPACWITSHFVLEREPVNIAYRPLAKASLAMGENWPTMPLLWYGTLGEHDVTSVAYDVFRNANR
jgi:hypothetical protein